MTGQRAINYNWHFILLFSSDLFPHHSQEEMPAFPVTRPKCAPCHSPLFLPLLCPSWTISSPSTQHNAGPAMSKTDWLWCFWTHRSQNLTWAVYSLQGTETWMSVDRGQQVHKSLFKTNCCTLSQLTTPSPQLPQYFVQPLMLETLPEPSLLDHKGQWMRGQYLRRMSYPI